MRERNFANSGGADAFPESELQVHQREGERLRRQKERCHSIIRELDHRTAIIRMSWNLSHRGKV